MAAFLDQHDRDHRHAQRSTDAGAEGVVGKQTKVPTGRGDVAAHVARSGRGAALSLRRLVETFRTATRNGGISTEQVLDARGAIRRLDAAIDQLAQLASPDAEAARDELIAERSALVPQIESLLAGDRTGAWRAEAAPIASQLGLASVDVRADDRARSVADAEGARGVALDDVVYLHPDRVAPGTREGREVLAHELVHVAQARVAGTENDQADRDAAEHEAAELASMIADGGAARAPQRRIDLSRPAADVHAKPMVASNNLYYLHLNSRQAWTVILKHLLSVVWPDPPRMKLDDKKFVEGLAAKWVKLVWDFEDPSELRQMLHPADPYVFIDGMRPMLDKTQKYAPPSTLNKIPRGGEVGLTDWRPAIGVAIGQLFEAAIIKSLHRVGPRWLAAADAASKDGSAGGHVELDPGVVPLSHHMDRAVVHALCQRGVVTVAHDASKPGKKNPKPGLKKVDFEWQGSKSKALWNWVRVTSPKDATAEDVAAAVFDYTKLDYGADNTSFLAYGITAAPPLFGIPGSWARHIPEARDHAPPKASAAEDTTHAHHVALAGSELAGELALIEAADVQQPAGARAFPETIDDIVAQTTFIEKVLKPWKVGAGVVKAMTFASSKRTALQDKTLNARWSPVLLAMKDNLSAIGAAIVQIDRSASQLVSKKTAPEAEPLRQVLEAYGDAAATAHLDDTCKRAIVRASELQAGLTLRSVQGSARAASTAMDGLRDAGSRDPQMTKEADYLDRKSKEIQSKLIRGQAVDPLELENFTFDSEVFALNARVDAIKIQLRIYEQAAKDAGDGYAAAFASVFSGEFRDLPHAIEMLLFELTFIWSNGQTRDRHEALAAAKKKFNDIAGNGKIKKFVERAKDLIENQQLRTAAVKIAALLGISLVGGFVGGMVARAVGGLFVRAGAVNAMGQLGLGARIVQSSAGILTDTAIASAGKVAIFGGNYGETFLENLIENVGSLAILKAITKNANELKKVEEATSKFWSTKGGLVLKEAAAITGHGIMGAALGYVAHKIVSGKSQPPPETAAEWLMQGASIAVGRHVGKHVFHRLDNIRQLAKIKDLQHGEALLRAAVDLHQQAKHVESRPDPNAALDLMSKRHSLLMQELDALDMVARRPALMKKAGYKEADIRRMQEDLKGQLGEIHGQGMADLPLHLAGMKEIVPGAVWRGSRDQIEHAVKSAKDAGIEVVAKRDPANRHWKIKLNGREIEAHERVGHVPASAKRPDHATRKHVPGADKPTYHPVEIKPDYAHGERSLTTGFIPGSAFKGKTVAHANFDAEKAHAEVLIKEANARIPDLATQVKGVRAIKKSNQGNTFVIQLADARGTTMSLDVQVGPLPANAVAIAVVNPTKQGKTYVDGDPVKIHGRHVIQLAVGLDRAQVERAVASQLGAIVSAQHSMHLGKYPKHNARPADGPLDPNDMGRIAEINVIARQVGRDGLRAKLGEPADPQAGSRRAELVALVEHMGLRRGTPGADERYGRMEPHLTKEAREQLEIARRPMDELSAADRKQRDAVEARAVADLRSAQPRPKDGEIHPLPPALAPKGQIANRGEIAEAARVAARVREMISERTLREYRDRAATQKPGEYITVPDMMIGGGAALAARRPGALLIDARGRWQVDGSENIAQTAHQLDKLRQAGFGDPRQVAGPNERVPLEAVRYWEDTIAAQGPVINGRATFDTAPDGRLLVRIKPTDGSAELVLAVGGKPTIASGFPPEKAPMSPTNTNIADSILLVEQRLGAIGNDSATPAHVRQVAMRLWTEMKTLQTGDHMDATMAHRRLEHEIGKLPEADRKLLLDALGKGKDGNPVNNALSTLEMTSKWTDTKNRDNNQSAFLGDEANHESIKQAASRKDAPKHWVVAGTGGTAISAVEIILANSAPDVKVTMLGRDNPSGLKENDQYRQVKAKYGDRLKIVVRSDMSLTSPKVDYSTGKPIYTALQYGEHVYKGDGYVSALGREQQVPPMVTALMMKARRSKGGKVEYQAQFDKDNNYLGYHIHITIGQQTHVFEVTGSVSRFVPRHRGDKASTDPNGLDKETSQRFDRASAIDAPGQGGNFDAGFVATATQAHRYAQDRKAREGK